MTLHWFRGGWSHTSIWNHHKKCIQISTNMPGIGSLICEIDVNISEIWENKRLLLSNTNALKSSNTLVGSIWRWRRQRDKNIKIFIRIWYQLYFTKCNYGAISVQNWTKFKHILYITQSPCVMPFVWCHDCTKVSECTIMEENREKKKNSKENQNWFCKNRYFPL